MCPRKKGQTNKVLQSLKIIPKKSNFSHTYLVDQKFINQCREILRANGDSQLYPDLETIRIHMNEINFPIGSLFVTCSPNLNPHDILGVGNWIELPSALYIKSTTSQNAGQLDQRSNQITIPSTTVSSDTHIHTHSGRTNAEEIILLIHNYKTDTENQHHTHTTAEHTLTSEEMPSHNHESLWQYPYNNPGTGHYIVPIMVGAGQYSGGTLRYTNNTGGLNGTTQPHSHGDTGIESNYHDHNLPEIRKNLTHSHSIYEGSLSNDTYTHSHTTPSQTVPVELASIGLCLWVRTQ